MRGSSLVVVGVLVSSLPAAADPGDYNAPCYPNDTCNRGLTCVAGTCQLVAGDEGQACYGNGTCNKGFACVDRKCVIEAPECRPPAKGIYDACVTRAKPGWRAFDDAFALDKARKQCTGVQDLEILDIAYKYMTMAFDPAFAMERALQYAANPRLRAKSAIVGYAAEQYARQFDGKFAIEWATKQSEALAADALACLRETVAANSQFDAKFGIEKAFQQCVKTHPAPICK
ncbi:MAG TPA: hypothetical protein VFQ53_29260 [Kofleriaceae bacterium]|nr:hypothetical protein [Kofleriaceae bacterium]